MRSDPRGLRAWRERPRPLRRWFLVAGALLTAGCARVEEPAAPGLPREWARHLVVVSLGRFRADHLAFFGYARNTTGHRSGAPQRAGEMDHTLDVLQRQGLVFTQAFVPCGGFEEGMSGWLRGASVRGGSLVRPDHPTLASWLAEHGWRTVALTSGLPVAEEDPVLEGFAEHEHVPMPHDLIPRVALVAEQAQGAPLATAGGPRGLCLWIHLDLAGGATDLLTPALAPYLDELLHPQDRVVVEEGFLAQRRRFQAGQAYTASEQRVLRALYDARLLYLHDTLRGVLYALASERPVLPDALLAVVGDRGSEIGTERAYVGARLSAREGALRVPLLLRGQRLPEGAFESAVVEACDLLPTALRALDVAAPPGLLGRDLQAVSNTRLVEGISCDGARTIRNARYRLVLPPVDPSTSFHRELELYDLAAAAGAELSRAPELPGVVDELRALLEP